MSQEFKLQDIIISLAHSIDMVSSFVHQHHLRVASLAESLAEEAGWSEEQKKRLILAAVLHDIGAVSSSDKAELVRMDVKEDHAHAALGAGMLQSFAYFADIVPVIRYHHHHWHNGAGSKIHGENVPEESFLLHLADRIEILIDPNLWVLDQVEKVKKTIQTLSGAVFKPDLVDVFLRASANDAFWLRIDGCSMETVLHRTLAHELPIPVDIDMLESLAQTFSHVIDFRSRFTATHSAGVASVAYALARLKHFPDEKCRQLRVAGYLHDIGKIAVPSEILNKPEKLTPQEFNRMKAHAFYTHEILSELGVLGDICDWASNHHERADGTGYSFGLDRRALSEESRIMTYADVLTALREDRPYRKPMPLHEAIRSIEIMLQPQKDDPIYQLLNQHLADIDNVRMLAQQQARATYQQIVRPN
ncbi:HD-GYP domain-containing protein [Tolumonas lignilytica]|uniref:HD-GYP domain-containing protein n=1 Tax=Tolumonas lignilytica TaxID=1283284 RepID=UPI00046327C0|nr:HD domain-containing phosphohydrolase [Tolumonas lignilytica]